MILIVKNRVQINIDTRNSISFENYIYTYIPKYISRYLDGKITDYF